MISSIITGNALPYHRKDIHTSSIILRPFMVLYCRSKKGPIEEQEEQKINEDGEEVDVDAGEGEGGAEEEADGVDEDNVMEEQDEADDNEEEEEMEEAQEET